MTHLDGRRFDGNLTFFCNTVYRGVYFDRSMFFGGNFSAVADSGNAGFAGFPTDFSAGRNLRG